MPLLAGKFNMMATCPGVAKLWQNCPVRHGFSEFLSPSASSVRD